MDKQCMGMMIRPLRLAWLAGFGAVLWLGASCAPRVPDDPDVHWERAPFEYAIGIMTGAHPAVWHDPHPSQAVNPVLTWRDVSDVPAAFVADPFMVRAEDGWHMFFETLDASLDRGVISWATSSDGFQWQYERVVLREPFHLSFPNVMKYEDTYYMVVESYQDDSVRLYRADPFPTDWRFERVLLQGEHVDNALFVHRGAWWLMTSTRRSDRLRLYHAPGPEGPWTEHPLSPLIEGNPHIARPGGRVIPWQDGLIRYPQDCWPMYGNAVHAFMIDKLTDEHYREKPWPDNPILSGSGEGWNALGMHHIDPHRLDEGQWIAVVDGVAPAQPDHRIVADFESGARLLGYALRPARRAAGTPVLLRFYWKEVDSFPGPPPAMFVHIRGEGFRFQADYHLVPGQEVYERRVTIPPEAPPGNYHIWVGLYDVESGNRQRVATRLARRRRAAALPLRLEVLPADPPASRRASACVHDDVRQP